MCSRSFVGLMLLMPKLLLLLPLILRRFLLRSVAVSLLFSCSRLYTAPGHVIRFGRQRSEARALFCVLSLHSVLQSLEPVTISQRRAGKIGSDTGVSSGMSERDMKCFISLFCVETYQAARFQHEIVIDFCTFFHVSTCNK